MTDINSKITDNDSANFTFADVLAHAYDASLEQDFETMISLLKFTEKNDDGKSVTFSMLRMAVQDACIFNYKLSVSPEKKLGEDEYSVVHSWVKIYGQRNGIKIVKGKPLASGKRPDFFAELEGETVPVECKKSFTSKSLAQLLEYMHEMNVKSGYAIACDFKVDLPDNITKIIVPKMWMLDED
ncbi:hypothetical protein [Acinetobacter sp. YH12098]|uniref:hypothetical protein n=1 Tax=Acinetobacter sp. YH12098 TaxID=2601087 RepID=UPI0015D1C981|nr:hypothetical protein [Acinetobacter sp. YH12098]